MGLFDKIFGTYSERELKRIEPIKNQVLALEDKYKQYTDSQLRAETDRFKSELASGKTLDDIMPEALAVCREAGARVLGKRAFPVQIIGAIVLHQGRIAEMKTGEGKTLYRLLGFISQRPFRQGSSRCNRQRLSCKIPVGGDGQGL